MLSNEKIKFIILRTFGNFFFLFALYGMCMTFGPAGYLELQYRFNQFRNVKYVVKAPQTNIVTPPLVKATPTPPVQTSFFRQLFGGDKVEAVSPVSSKFGIIIPKIGANAAIEPNVDPGKAEQYLDALKKGVAHAAGTVFPGVAGNIYLFAHSTDAFWNVGRYNAIFYLIKELNPGDEIDIFYLGVRHIYRVVEKKVIDPKEIEYLTTPLPFEQLTLQTCWPPGTTLKRLLVIAKPESEI